MVLFRLADETYQSCSANIAFAHVTVNADTEFQIIKEAYNIAGLPVSCGPPCFRGCKGMVESVVLSRE